jgi:DNA-3-methyladenine glycosylase
MPVLDQSFFARPALKVAKDLIGKHLVRRIHGEEIAAVITETEAYVGPHDLACHGSKGRTARTEVMFGPPGCWYVYFIYGIHWMLNVVTDDVGHPAAVLVRGAGAWDGPARLTKALAIDKALNSLPAVRKTGLWIEDRGGAPPRGSIERTPRIGVDYAGDWASKPYRFVLSPSMELESRGYSTRSAGSDVQAQGHSRRSRG